MPKDNFSTQAHLYAKFRPKYPAALYNFVLSKVQNRQIAWDCATGNGQVASELAHYFEQVLATDVSQKQLDNAHQNPKITYTVSQAEHTNFPDNTFDLITVGQALHWFKFEEFYREVRRISKPEAILAVWGYGTMTIDNQSINHQFQHFYQEQIGKYWDAERRYIDDEYRSIPFEFEEIESPNFEMNYEWTVDELEGYLNTWSSVQKYINLHGENPVNQFIDNVKFEGKIKICFPIFLKIGKIVK
ncbi:MAG: class I SAM-dependent methyltransferase [Arcicella sp.]|jgi:SAM-dependent methyltransferase|nr:class I SAM-dependent methyltransferase [Arcicella sp.]